MGLFTKIFGGSRSEATSGNQAHDYIKGTYGGEINTGQAANQAIAGALGLGAPPAPVNALEGGTPAAPGAAPAGGAAAVPGGFQNYLDSAGYNFAFDQGQRAITGSAAARGLLKSGSTLKALNRFGQGIGQQYFNNYLDRLEGVASRGLQAGSLVSSTGQTSTSEGSNDKGLIGGIGKAIGGILCDIRAKVVGDLVAVLPNGVKIHEFTYKGSNERHVGPVAQQVREVLPSAVFEEGGLLYVDMAQVLETPAQLEV